MWGRPPAPRGEGGSAATSRPVGLTAGLVLPWSLRPRPGGPGAAWRQGPRRAGALCSQLFPACEGVRLALGGAGQDVPAGALVTHGLTLGPGSGPKR